jgi:hypothetical protein
MSEKIYVAIASYRDIFTQRTIDSLLENASFPENITVGVFIQEFKEESPIINKKYLNNVFIETVEAGHIFSVTYCRNQSLKFLTNEKYVMQIDSHTIFKKNWDELLIKSFKEIKDDKKVLNARLSSWYMDLNGNITFKETPDAFGIFTYNKEEAYKNFAKHYELVPFAYKLVYSNENSLKDWYLHGHFIFAESTFFKEIKQPEWICFWGEELMFALRAFTAGYNVYTIKNAPLYHKDEYPPGHLEKEVKRERIWKSFSEEFRAATVLTTNTIFDIINNEIVGEEYLFEKRKLAELYDMIGYSLKEVFLKWQQDYYIKGVR